jgi:hypothetical protein
VTAVSLWRHPGRPRSVTPLQTRHTVYEVQLSGVPSRYWRAAFTKPPAALRRPPFTPDGVELQGSAVIFRAALSKVQDWLRWIERSRCLCHSVAESCTVSRAPRRTATRLGRDDESPTQQAIVSHEPRLSLKVAQVADTGSNPLPVLPRDGRQTGVRHQIGPYREPLTQTPFEEEPVRERGFVNHPRRVFTEGAGNIDRKRSSATRLPSARTKLPHRARYFTLREAVPSRFSETAHMEERAVLIHHGFARTDGRGTEGTDGIGGACRRRPHSRIRCRRPV